MMEQASRRVGITGISHILLIRLLRVEKDTTVAFPICNIVFADTHSRHRNTILQTAHQENGGKSPRKHIVKQKITICPTAIFATIMKK